MRNIQMLSESLESERLQKLIDREVKELRRDKPDWAQKNLQSKILFLKNEILPIVLRNTTLLYGEIVKFLETKIREAVNLECNDIIIVINLSEQKDEVRRIGTVIPDSNIGITVSADYGQKVEEVPL